MSASAARNREKPAPWWLVASAVLAGVILGALGQIRSPIEERLLDGSLVLSGEVSYPDGALLGLYYRGMWTLLYQLGALILAAGVGYTAANDFFQLLPPPIMTSAFALFIHGLTGRPLFSLVAAILCFMHGGFATLFQSPDYPLLGIAWNSPSPSSYGRFAGALAALSFAALVGGWQALAAFAAAVLVAVHPVVGAYTVTMLAVGLGVARMAWGNPISRRLLIGLAAGASITLASFAAFLLMRQDMPVVDDATNRVLIDAYMSFWEGHRNAGPERPDRLAILFVLAAGSLGLFLAVRGGRRATADAGAVALLAAVIASTFLYVLYHWGRAFLPDLVVRTIPGRFINIQAGFAMPLAIAMMVFVSDQLAQRFRHRAPSIGAIAIFLRFPNVVVGTILLILLARFLPGFVQLVATASDDPETLATRQQLAEIDSPFWSKVRALRINRLVLVAPEISLAALRYGRLPVALETDIDFVPYLPRTATALAALVERGYGISFVDPPPILHFTGTLPSGAGQDYWACLSRSQWHRLAREFDIGAVLVPADWTVRLPLILSDARYALYSVPSGEPASASAAPAETPCPLRRG